MGESPRALLNGAGIALLPELKTSFFFGPPIKQEDPPNLSILISGGRETNQDSPSNGE